ncbi:hypothetical protein ABZY93_27215 [Streptomyces smyrnaeus]|uniref:hypothetical protein n=1 Tax=Streptomyces smyrnaeus TaxID=1387713 RepID=UPI0033B803CC
MGDYDGVAQLVREVLTITHDPGYAVEIMRCAAEGDVWLGCRLTPSASAAT